MPFNNISYTYDEYMHLHVKWMYPLRYTDQLRVKPWTCYLTCDNWDVQLQLLYVTELYRVTIFTAEHCDLPNQRKHSAVTTSDHHWMACGWGSSMSLYIIYWDKKERILLAGNLSCKDTIDGCYKGGVI